jgi:hypothetical protein
MYSTDGQKVRVTPDSRREITINFKSSERGRPLYTAY